MMHRDETRIFRNQNRCLAAALAFAVMLLGAQASSWAASGDESGAAPVARIDGAATGSNVAARPQRPSMTDSYAARETSSKTLETFKGATSSSSGAAAS